MSEVHSKQKTELPLEIRSSNGFESEQSAKSSEIRVRFDAQEKLFGALPMKLVLFTGGFAGFLIATLASNSTDRASDLAMRDAVVGCLLGAILFHWFWSAVVAVIDQIHVAKRATVHSRTASVTPPKAR